MTPHAAAPTVARKARQHARTELSQARRDEVCGRSSQASSHLCNASHGELRAHTEAGAATIASERPAPGAVRRVSVQRGSPRRANPITARTPQRGCRDARATCAATCPASDAIITPHLTLRNLPATARPPQMLTPPLKVAERIRDAQKEQPADAAGTVSYTHLTLPTILLV